MGHHEDYKAKINMDKKRRLENVALQILQSSEVHIKTSPKETIEQCIKIAKEFIIQIDAENFDVKK